MAIRTISDTPFLHCQALSIKVLNCRRKILDPSPSIVLNLEHSFSKVNSFTDECPLLLYFSSRISHLNLTRKTNFQISNKLERSCKITFVSQLSIWRNQSFGKLWLEMGSSKFSFVFHLTKEKIMVASILCIYRAGLRFSYFFKFT